MIIVGDSKGADIINDAYLQTPDAEEGCNKPTRAAHRLWLRILFGKDGDLRGLKDLAENYPNSSQVQNYLARAYEEYENYFDAAKTFENAAALSGVPEEKAKLLGDAAVQYIKAGFQVDADETLKKLKAMLINAEMRESEFFGILRNFLEADGDDRFVLPVLERIIEIDPDDIDTRFTLAYKYSERENSDMALWHYRKIPHQKRSGMAWNNLGVVLDAFDLPGKSVNAYEGAKALDETLAMSNLATRFLSVGFAKNAQELCDNALEIEGYHKNVSHVLAKIKDLPDQEEKKLEKILERAKPKNEYYRMVGRAMALAEPKDIGGSWRGPVCALELKISRRLVTITGSYDQQTNALAAALGAGGSGVRRRVEYTGTLFGHAIVGKCSRSQDGAPPRTLLDEAGNERPTLMVLSDDLSEVHVMEVRGSSARRRSTTSSPRPARTIGRSDA